MDYADVPGAKEFFEDEKKRLDEAEKLRCDPDATVNQFRILFGLPVLCDGEARLSDGLPKHMQCGFSE